MTKVKPKASLPSRRLLVVAVLCLLFCVQVWCQEQKGDHDKKHGDKCTSDQECKFEGSVCNPVCNCCQCKAEFPVTNHLDKCGTVSKLNESCFFNEQCEYFLKLTECRDGICSCKLEERAVIKPDGSYQCVAEETSAPDVYGDSTMIVILVVMCLMCITICVVLRLFSKARWRENRTIFNTPNPRLMNASLLRENKALHQDRRGSKTSTKGPSRQASVASLRPHSPSLTDSQRDSSSSIKHSAGQKATEPMLGNVTIEVEH